MVTKSYLITYLPSNICNSIDRSDSSESGDISNSGDSSEKNSLTTQLFLLQKIHFLPKINCKILVKKKIQPKVVTVVTLVTKNVQ